MRILTLGITRLCKELISLKCLALYVMNVSCFFFAVHSHVQEGTTTIYAFSVICSFYYSTIILVLLIYRNILKFSKGKTKKVKEDQTVTLCGICKVKLF